MRTHGRRILIGTLALVAALTAVVGTAVLLSADPDLERCRLAEQSVWFTPLVAASVIGGATLVLLSQRRSRDDASAARGTAPCSACGRELLGEWRMCPYCGAMPGRTDRTRAPGRDQH